MSFLVVDKPSGMTSHDVVDRVRKITGERKVGHAGTLDPMATGVLVVGMKRSTRLLRFVQGLPKTYVAGAILGVATDTLDAEGAILSREPMNVSEGELRAVLGRFIGSVSQVPPMVSALKVGGKRLYELAREGKNIAREARTVEIHAIELEDFSPGAYPEFVMTVTCGSGTYIRTLADDIGQALGGCAHLSSLRRTAIGRLADPTPLAEIESSGIETFVLTPAEALADLPSVAVDAATAEAVLHGSVFPAGVLTDIENATFTVVDVSGTVLAVYRSDGTRAKPEVVLS